MLGALHANMCQKKGRKSSSFHRVWYIWQLVFSAGKQGDKAERDMRVVNRHSLAGEWRNTSNCLVVTDCSLPGWLSATLTVVDYLALSVEILLPTRQEV